MAIKSSNQITFTEHKKIIEIKEWYLATSLNVGITIDTDGWTTDIQTIDYTNKYLWNYEEVIYSIGSSEKSEPVIMGYYGEGNGIANITNYYQITKEPVAPNIDDMTLWSKDAPLLTPENKYLWNYEIITYTNGTTENTEPVLIGVYGDSGVNAITFEIYSTQGFTFKENLKSIDLKIAAFEGGEPIVDATYTWEWWNDTLNDGDGGYSIIVENSVNQLLTVRESDEYAFANLRCTMSYNGKTYEDYVVLSSETVIYTSRVRFFNDTNVFGANDLYLIAYVILYQNNREIESIITTKYYNGISTIEQDGTIKPQPIGDFTNEDKMYFIRKNTDYPYYEAILGTYVDGQWRVEDSSTNYKYHNTLYGNYPENTNILVISKEDINKSKIIDIGIYDNNDILITTTSVTVIDSNDPIVSETAPNNPVLGQLWLDTSIIPSVLKIFNELGEWVDCSSQIGDAIYTSKPSSYSIGDLWILSEGEVCGVFGPGSMLKATITSKTFDESHWIDADATTTELKNNILQTFTFNPGSDSNKGLPGLTIGQKDNAFYTNISSTEMGFYDNSEGQNQKVVSISKNSANIKNLIVEESANFNCNAKFNSEVDFFGFVWKKEVNGSLSLAIST